MDIFSGTQTEKLRLKFKEIREHIHTRPRDVSITEVTFVEESITNVEKHLNKLSERDKSQNVFTYDTDTISSIETVKINLKHVSENRLTKSDFKLRMLVKEYTEMLDTMLSKIQSPSGLYKCLDGERRSDSLRSADIDCTPTAEKCKDIPGIFYNIGCGIQMLAESDVSSRIHAIQWKFEDFQDFFMRNSTLKGYNLETDFFKIESKDPKDKENFPRDSSGMITVMLTLPNDINYSFLQLKAYIKVEKTWNLVEASLKVKTVTFRTVKLDSFCIVSTPIIEKVLIPPEGYKFVAKTDSRIQIDFPPGTVEKEESMSVHVIPANRQVLRRKYEERTKKGEAIIANSDCLCTSWKTPLKKKVKVKLPLNDIRMPNESDEDTECRLFKRQNTNGKFTVTDTEVALDENNTAVFETNIISGTSVSRIGKEELKKGQLVISGNIEEMLGLKYICKVVFFVSDVSSCGLNVLLACIEKSKMEEFCLSCEEKEFLHYKNWTSKDLIFEPQIKINISLKGCFSLPRYATRKILDLTFYQNSTENFTRFRVDIKPKIDQDVYGIFLLTKDQVFVDEIFYNTHSTKGYAHGSTLKGQHKPNQTGKLALKKATTPKAGAFTSRTPTLAILQNSDDDFLTEKGVLAVAKLLNADSLFQTVVNLDLKTVQIDKISEKIPVSSRQAFVLLKTALDQHKNNKIDKLLSALESAGEGGLAENIRKLYKDHHDLSQIQK